MGGLYIGGAESDVVAQVEAQVHIYSFPRELRLKEMYSMPLNLQKQEFRSHYRFYEHMIASL